MLTCNSRVGGREPRTWPGALGLTRRAGPQGPPRAAHQVHSPGPRHSCGWSPSASPPRSSPSAHGSPRGALRERLVSPRGLSATTEGQEGPEVTSGPPGGKAARAGPRAGGPEDRANVPSQARLRAHAAHGACVPRALGQLCPQVPTSLPQSWREAPSAPLGSLVHTPPPATSKLASQHAVSSCASAPWAHCSDWPDVLLPSKATWPF